MLYLTFFIMTKPTVSNSPNWFFGFLILYIIQEIMSTALEIVQIKEQKNKLAYIKDIWNFIDVFRIIFSWVYIIVTLISNNTEDKVHPNTFVSALNIMIFSKIFYALNQFKRMRVLIALVKQVAKDIVPFAIFQGIAMLMIGSTSYNLKLQYKKNKETGVYENKASEPFLQSIRGVYLLTLGEFDLDDLGFAQWVLFFVATFLLQIMMFNLLIAILSDTFATVMSQIEESD